MQHISHAGGMKSNGTAENEELSRAASNYVLTVPSEYGGFDRGELAV